MAFRIGIIVTPNFNAFATLAFIDPFRAANYLSNKVLYRWYLLSSEGGTIRASNGLSMDTAKLESLGPPHPDMIAVSSSWTPEANYGDKVLMGALRQWGRSGAALCGIDTGTFILAKAGLLKRHRATTHYEHIDSLQEVHPDVEVSEQLFVIDGNALTCGGGVASVDLSLQIVRMQHGDALANAAARYIFHDRLRLQSEQQSTAGYEPTGQTTPETLRKAILIMERHLEEPLPIPEIADQVGVSQRQLTRLFRHYTNGSIVQYYRDIRLDRARSLVTQTEMSVLQVAVACGFSNVEHFSRAYRKRFGITPRNDRIEGRVPFEFRAWPMHSLG